MSDEFKPIFIVCDAGDIDHTAIARMLGDQMQHVMVVTEPPITATEIRMRMEESMRGPLARLQERLLKPLFDRTFDIALGPRRKSWDQYGAYHRRQLKKWRKRQAKFHITE